MIRLMFSYAVFALSTINTTSAQSQRAAYDSWTEKAVTATQKGLHLEAAWAYNRAFVSGPGGDDPWTDRHDAALAWTRAARPDSAMAQLWYLARHTGYGEFAELELDPGFDALKGRPDWKPLLAQIRSNRFISDPVTEPELAERLAYLLVFDQRYRTRLESFPHGSIGTNPDALRVIDSMRRTDALSVQFVDSLLQHRGWIGNKQIGRRGVSTVFMILQHADSATQLKYLPVLREAASTGNLPNHDLAMFEDRVALQQGREQLYGTQIYCDSGGCHIARLADPLHVDERRKSMGLEPLSGYAAQWDIVWDAAACEKAQKAGQAK
jgi:hypothetical protein